jgi:hypothetical protein
VDCTGRERTKATLEKQDSCDKNFQGAEAYCWRSKTEGTSFRNRDRAQTTTQKAFLVGVDLTRTMVAQFRLPWLACVSSYAR